MAPGPAHRTAQDVGRGARAEPARPGAVAVVRRGRGGQHAHPARRARPSAHLRRGPRYRPGRGPARTRPAPCGRPGQRSALPDDEPDRRAGGAVRPRRLLVRAADLRVPELLPAAAPRAAGRVRRHPPVHRGRGPGRRAAGWRGPAGLGAPPAPRRRARLRPARGLGRHPAGHLPGGRRAARAPRGLVRPRRGPGRGRVLLRDQPGHGRVLDPAPRTGLRGVPERDDRALRRHPAVAGAARPVPRRARHCLRPARRGRWRAWPSATAGKGILRTDCKADGISW